MSSILIVDTKLMMYKQFHSHKPALGFLEEVANLGLRLLPHIHKVVFVKDLGKSKRCEIFPDYKGKRKETRDNMTSTEKNRLAKFLSIYDKVDELLATMGSVIAINGIEADDIASMIAKRLGGQHDIYLLSGDSDWGRFLVNENTTMVHPQRAKLITKYTAHLEFGVFPEHQLLVDSVTGVDKESVDGITKLGKVRAVKFLEEVLYDKDKFFDLLDEHLAIRKYGMVLPSWANSARDVYDRNYKIFETHTYESLTKDEEKDFLDGWAIKPARSLQETLKVSIFSLDTPYIPPLNVINFFKIKED